MSFRGKITYIQKGFYASLIWPLVQVKKAFQLIYNLILKIVWSELIEGKKIDNELASLAVFLIFCLFSLVTYYLQNYRELIIIAFFWVWFLDYWFAKSQYFYSKKQTTIFLDNRKNDFVLWYMNLPNGKTRKAKFERSQIGQISISKTYVYGGAFEEKIGTVWEVYVTLCDWSEFLIYEHRKLIDAVKEAKQLVTYFDVPLIFVSSEGNGAYAAQRLNFQESNHQTSWPKTIQFQTTPRKWHIYSKWRLTSSWYLLKQIFQKSGFLLFVLTVTAFMTRFGDLLNFFIAIYLGREDITLELPSIFGWFEPNIVWNDVVKLTIASAILIFKGWHLSREKHIYIDTDQLEYFIDNNKIAQLKTNEIEATLFVKNPDPAILIIAQNIAIEIKDLQQEEFIALLLKLEEGMMQLKIA
jgi:hypothetical protein